MFVLVQTLQRLEAGYPTVGLAALESALHVFGMTNRLAEVVASDSDKAGMSQEHARLPQRIHAPTRDDLDF